jgi:hypothetical protein
MEKMLRDAQIKICSAIEEADGVGKVRDKMLSHKKDFIMHHARAHT